MQDVAKHLKVKHHVCVMKNHQGNSRVERKLRDLLDMYKKLLIELAWPATKFDQLIEIVSSAINNTKSKSLGGFAPIELFQNVEARRPVDVIFGPDKAALETFTVGNYLKTQKTLFEELIDAYKTGITDKLVTVSLAREKTRKWNEQQQQKWKPQFPMLEAGDYVMVAEGQSGAGKLNSAWSGPYQVVQKLREGYEWEVRDLVLKKNRCVPVSLLWPYENLLMNTEDGIKAQAKFLATNWSKIPTEYS
jgi:hypothetical protein